MADSWRTQFLSPLKEAAPIVFGIIGLFAAVVTIWLNIGVAQAADVMVETSEEDNTEVVLDEG